MSFLILISLYLPGQNKGGLALLFQTNRKLKTFLFVAAGAYISVGVVVVPPPSGKAVLWWRRFFLFFFFFMCDLLRGRISLPLLALSSSFEWLQQNLSIFTQPRIERQTDKETIVRNTFVFQRNKLLLTLSDAIKMNKNRGEVFFFIKNETNSDFYFVLQNFRLAVK